MSTKAIKKGYLKFGVGKKKYFSAMNTTELFSQSLTTPIHLVNR
jgi:hypothetical protein